MLYTELGKFDTAEDYERTLWRERIAKERQKQIERGYDADHDSEHGIDHLLGWAQEYARVGKPVASAALVEAARELLAKEPRSC